MFSTKHLCVKDYFIPNSVPKNDQFPNFKQLIFHAGTREQFSEYAIKKLKVLENTGNQKSKTKQWFNKPSLNNGINSNDNVIKTFDYMFDFVKKGIFVQIRDNILN